MFDTLVYKILSYILLHHRCEVLVLNFLLLSQLVLPLVWMVTLFFSFNRDCGVISILHCIMIRLIQIRECWLVSTHVIGTACIQIPHILVGFLLCMTHHQKRYFFILESVAVHHLCFLCHQLFLDLPCLIVESVVA